MNELSRDWYMTFIVTLSINMWIDVFTSLFLWACWSYGDPPWHAGSLALGWFMAGAVHSAINARRSANGYGT